MVKFPPTRRNLAALACVDLPARGRSKVGVSSFYLPLAGRSERVALRVGVHA